MGEKLIPCLTGMNITTRRKAGCTMLKLLRRLHKGAQYAVD